MDGGQELTAFPEFTLPNVDTRGQNYGSMRAILREQLMLNPAASSLPDPAQLPFNSNQQFRYGFGTNS